MKKSSLFCDWEHTFLKMKMYLILSGFQLPVRKERRFFKRRVIKLRIKMESLCDSDDGLIHSTDNINLSNVYCGISKVYQMYDEKKNAIIYCEKAMKINLRC